MARSQNWPRCSRDVEPRCGVGGARGSCPTGSRVRPQESPVFGFGVEATLRGQQGGGGAVRGAENSQRRRGGTKGARLCAVSGPQGRQGRRRPSPTRPRALSPCPAQNRSARTAAERMANPRRRSAGGGLGPGTAGTLVRVGWTDDRGAGCSGAGADCGRRAQLPCLRLSVGPPTSLSSLGSGTAGIYIPPTPEMTSSGPPLPPFSYPPGGPPAARSALSLTPLAFGLCGSQLLGLAARRLSGFQEVARGLG